MTLSATPPEAVTVLLYDGTLSGFLTAVFTSYERTGECAVLPQADYVPSLFSGAVTVAADAAKSARVFRALRRLDDRVWHAVFTAWLADGVSPAERDDLLLGFIRQVVCRGARMLRREQDDPTRSVLRWSRRVLSEAHRFAGLLRFEQTNDGTYYARFEPDHNVLPLLGHHFRRRMPNERWAVHDLRRSAALLYDNGELNMVDVAEVDEGARSVGGGERRYQRMWREYCRRTAVEGRRNPELQRRFIPRKYWAHITELSPDNPG